MNKLFEFIKKNWLALAVGVLIIGILIHDVLEQFVWQTGLAFRTNSMYMFLLYIILFVAVPIAVIEHIFKDKYKDIELDDYKEKCDSPKDVVRIIFGGIGKLIFAVAFPLGMIFLIAFVSDKLLERVIDVSEAYIFVSDFMYLPIVAGLGLICILVWLFSKKGVMARDYSDDAKIDFFAAGERARLPFKVKLAIAGISVVVFLFTMYVPTFSYNCVTENGVIRKCFWMEKSYGWQDVEYYSFRMVEKGALAFIIEMKDGNTIIMGESLSANLPEDKYPEGQNDFILRLVETLQEEGVSFYIKDWDRFYESLQYEDDRAFVLKIKEMSMK